MNVGAYQRTSHNIGAYQDVFGWIWVNDAQSKDGGEVEQTYPGPDNWSDTSIDMQNVIDTTGLSGQLYVGVETAVGDIDWHAITVSSGSNIVNLTGAGRGVGRGVARGVG